jgi:hypothetical protein
LKDRFVSITVQPEYVGLLAGMDLKRFFLAAFNRAKEEASKYKLTSFRATVIFPFEEAGDKHAPLDHTRLDMDPEELKAKIDSYIDRLSGLIQSWQHVKISSLKFNFQFYYVPSGAGGRAIESRELAEIYKKRSVIRIKEPGPVMLLESSFCYTRQKGSTYC